MEQVDVARLLSAALARGLSSGLPGTWRLAEREWEQGISLIFEAPDRRLLVELEPRDDGRPCFARTARFNLYYDLAGRGADLKADERSLMERCVALAAECERAVPDIDPSPIHRRSLLREVRVGRMLVREPGGGWYLNPYVGCLIGCPFCYAAHRTGFVRRLNGLPELPWGRYVDVKINAAEVLAGEVGRLPPGPVRISPIVTDPYQPPERKYHITRACLEILGGAGFRPVVLTRAVRVLDDLPLLARIPGAAVGFSVPTDDDRIRAIFEPGADPIEERLEAIRRLRAAGVNVFAQVQPALPMDPERLASLLAPHVARVRIDRLYEGGRLESLPDPARMAQAMDDAWFADVRARLRRAFATYGVAEASLDNLGELG